MPYGIDPEKGVGMPIWESAEQLDYVTRRRMARLILGGTTSVGYSSTEEAETVEAAVHKAAEVLGIGVRVTRAKRDTTRGSGEPTGYITVQRVARGRGSQAGVAS
jgi:cytosine/adenosine deaminase-related metal-dependent hydrolase